MAKATLKLTGLEKAISQIGKFRLDKQKEVQQELDRTALMIESQAKRNVQDNGAIDQARLFSSIVRQEIGPFRRSVGTNVEYAAAVEFGRGPGKMPPLEPIKAWAKRKGLPESAAWPIAMKIKREGTKPRPFLFPAAEAERQQFLANLKRILSTP